MSIPKQHQEFYALDLNTGWETPPGYPAGIEQKILSGLLDEQKKLEALLAEHPKSTALGHFVAGERHLKAQRYQDATNAFVECLTAEGGDWLTMAARARLQELRTRSAQASAFAPQD